MEVATAVRKIRRQFGDEYNVVITEGDILDWIHDAELDIIRSTSDNDTKLNIPANQFPVTVPDRVNIKRLSVANKAIAHTTLTELDLTSSNTDVKGGAVYWYFQSGKICLWPVTETDTYLVEVLYSKTPTPMSIVAPFLQWQNAATGDGGYALVTANQAWEEMVNFNVTFDISFDTPGTYYLMTMGPDQSINHLHWSIVYTLNTVGVLSFKISVSDGATVRVENALVYSTTYKAGTRILIRLVYNEAIGTVSIYNVDSSGNETFIGASAPWGSFQVQTVYDADIIIGAADLPIPIPIPRPSFTLYGFELLSGIVSLTAYPVFTFNGQSDLINLPGIPLTPFSTASGHTMSIGGEIQKYALNECPRSISRRYRKILSR